MKHLARSLILATSLSFGLAGAANAAPTLSINPQTGPLTDAFQTEAGQSIPTGIGGFVGGTLLGSEAGFYTFTYGPPGLVGGGTGHGNSTNLDAFFVGPDLATALGLGNVFCTQAITGICAAASSPGDHFTVNLPAGAIPFGFAYDLASDGTGGHTLLNGQLDNANGAYLAQLGLGTSPFAGPGVMGLLGLSDNPFPADSDFQDLTLAVNVPEPASLAVFGIGLIGLGAIRRRRKAREQQ